MNNRNRILTTVSIYHGFNDGSLAVIPILFPIFKEIFNLSYTQIGIITGGGLAISLFTEIVVGRAFDYSNSRTLLSSGIFLLSISMFVLTLSNNFASLLLFVFLIRFSSGFFHPAGIGLISRAFKKHRIDWAMGMQSAFGDFGAFISLLTTLYLAEYFGWKFPLYIWFIIGLICLLIGLSLTKKIKKELLKNKKIDTKKQSFKEAIKEWFEIIKKFKYIIPLFIVSSASYGLTISYLPLFLNEKTTLSLGSIGIIISIWVGMGVIACLLYSKIHLYITRKFLIILSYIIIGLVGFLIIITTSISVLIILVILLGLSTFLSFPALFSLVSEAIHENIEGKTFGYIFTLQLGIGTILLFLSGVLSDVFGIWVPFALLGCLGIFAFFIIVLNNKLVFPCI